MLFIYQTQTQTAFDDGKSLYVFHLVIVILTGPLRFISMTLCLTKLTLHHVQVPIFLFPFTISRLVHAQTILSLQALLAQTRLSLAFVIPFFVHFGSPSLLLKVLTATFSESAPLFIVGDRAHLKYFCLKNHHLLLKLCNKILEQFLS